MNKRYAHRPEIRERLTGAEQRVVDGIATRTRGETATQRFLDTLKSP